MRKKLIAVLLSILLLLSFSSCASKSESDSNAVNDTAAEQTTEATGVDTVSPEYDENGNPTGEYAKYIWEEQQKEEAMNSIAEDAQRQMYEDMYEPEPGGFPLD